MASPSYTYTLTNGTTADADQVMQNFNDILSGVSDGTKDLSINALTVAGTASLNGAVDLGNATGDLISVAGRFDTSLIPTTADTYDLGSTTGGWANLYLGDNSQYLVLTAAPAASASWTFTFPATAGSASQLLRNTGSGTMAWTGLTIDASDNIVTTGNATIGGASPGGTATLEVTRSDTATSVSAFDSQIQVFNSDTASSTAGRYASIDFGVSGSAGATANAVIAGEYSSAGNMSLNFYTDSSNILGKRLEISAAGNFDFQSGNLTTTGAVGVGTAASGTHQYIQSTNATSAAMKITNSNASGNIMWMDLSAHTGDTSDYFLYAENATALMHKLGSNGDVYHYGNVGIGTGGPSAPLHVSGDTATDGADMCLMENTEATINSSDFILNLQFSGDTDPTGGYYVLMGRSGDAEIGAIVAASSTTVNFSTTSDGRYKDVVGPIPNAIETLNKLNPVEFKWKETGEHDFGVIAQEAYEVYPSAIVKPQDENAEKGGKWKADYGKFTPLLLAAVKELAAKVEALEAQA